MEVAGVNFVINSRDPITLQDLPAIYKPFHERPNSGGRQISIKVTLELHNMPDTEKMEKTFDTGQSWALFMSKDEYFLALNSSISKEVIWMARFNQSVENITVYCGKTLIDGAGGTTRLSNPISYPLDQLLLMYILAKRQGAIIHASGIGMNNRGYIFPGKSGAGKSTLSRLFICRAGMEMLSDDRVVVRGTDSGFKAFGTPWTGKAEIAENKGLPLGGICFIRQSPGNSIRELTSQEALRRLMPVTSIPWYDENLMSCVVLFCEDLVSKIPAYELQFRPDIGTVDFIENYFSEK